MSLRSHRNRSEEALRMTLAGASRNATLAAANPLPGHSNYLLGNQPSRWHLGVPQFARVRYENVYPGINLVFYGNQGQLEYDFQVAPGADPAQAQLDFEGTKKVELSNGNVVLTAEGGSVQLEAPRVYQTINGRQQPVDACFVLLAANRVGFEIGAYDRTANSSSIPS